MFRSRVRAGVRCASRCTLTYALAETGALLEGPGGAVPGQLPRPHRRALGLHSNAGETPTD
jgi:hypothetical protein